MSALWYERCLRRTLPLDDKRRIQVKHYIVTTPSLESTLAFYFLEDTRTSERIIRLIKSHSHTPQYSIAPYLLGLTLYNEEVYKEAIFYLKLALSLELPEETMTWKVLEILGKAAYFSDDYNTSEQAFKRLAEMQVPVGIGLTAEDWLKRIEWKKKKLSTTELGKSVNP